MPAQNQHLVALHYIHRENLQPIANIALIDASLVKPECGSTLVLLLEFCHHLLGCGGSSRGCGGRGRGGDFRNDRLKMTV